MSPEHLLVAGRDADGHQRIVEGRVGLTHADVTHARTGEACCDLGKLSLARSRKHDRMGAFVQISRRTLAGRMHDVCGQDPYREIASDDNVVKEDVRASPFRRITAFARAS